MEPNGQQVLVIGLPETGKSSFIQALDEILKHPGTWNALRADGLAHDRSYIQSDKPDFLAGEKLGRTPRQADDTFVELWFEHPPTGRRGRLYLPDKKGEVFLDQWTNRRWEREYRQSLPSIAGALVFVHAEQKARNDERLGVLAMEVQQSDAERPWEIKAASAQVQLVDVLQFIAEHSDAPRPLRVALLISAWDTVGSAAGDLRPKEPAKFLEREWALVAQYLRANPQSFTSRTYGVSAYGGKPGELGALAERPPHERSQLVEGAETSNDLTRPLRWLLELD
jgi:Double-GTPase 1